jgi:hypothetical protein
MIRHRMRFYATLAAAFLGGAVIGGLLGWALHKTPTLAGVTLGLAIVGSGPGMSKL